MKNLQLFSNESLGTYLKLSFITLLMVFMVSCESDDGDNLDTGSENVPEGVPVGEIVPLEEREFILTGFGSTTGRSTAANQRRWKYDFGEVFSSNCPENNQDISGDYYLSFSPSGTLEYTNESGSSIANSRSWEWADNKSAIILSGIKFTFTELNANRVVYYSDQSNSECSIVTYEVMHEPILE